MVNEKSEYKLQMNKNNQFTDDYYRGDVVDEDDCLYEDVQDFPPPPDSFPQNYIDTNDSLPPPPSPSSFLPPSIRSNFLKDDENVYEDLGDFPPPPDLSPPQVSGSPFSPSRTKSQPSSSGKKPPPPPIRECSLLHQQSLPAPHLSTSIANSSIREEDAHSEGESVYEELNPEEEGINTAEPAGKYSFKDVQEDYSDVSLSSFRTSTESLPRGLINWQNLKSKYNLQHNTSSLPRGKVNWRKVKSKCMSASLPQITDLEAFAESQHSLRMEKKRVEKKESKKEICIIPHGDQISTIKRKKQQYFFQR